MRLTHITIENFKGIRERVEIPLGPITLLFGANSAGKSTMLQALLYLRELLERQNADADLLSASGTAIHLGGFRQLVHMHDVGRVIRVGVTLELDDDGLPEYRLPGAVEQSSEDMQMPAWMNLKTAGVEVTVSWDAAIAAPVISCYSIFGDGKLMAKIEPSSVGKQLLSLEEYHPYFKTCTDDGSDTDTVDSIVGPLGFFVYAELILLQPSVIPRFHQPVFAEASERADMVYGTPEELGEGLRPVISGPGELILGQLQKIRYIGPVREFPERGALAQLSLIHI